MGGKDIYFVISALKFLSYNSFSFFRLDLVVLHFAFFSLLCCCIRPPLLLSFFYFWLLTFLRFLSIYCEERERELLFCCILYVLVMRIYFIRQIFAFNFPCLASTTDSCTTICSNLMAAGGEVAAVVACKIYRFLFDCLFTNL